MTKTQMKVGLAVLAVGLLASVTSASAGYRVGYDDASYFNREYKKLFGAPPLRHLDNLKDGRYRRLSCWTPKGEAWSRPTSSTCRRARSS